jgi:hypothetical protein
MKAPEMQSVGMRARTQMMIYDFQTRLAGPWVTASSMVYLGWRVQEK